MKKLICLLAMAVFSTNTFASILIKLNNITNDKNIFVASVSDGKRIYAENIGTIAVVKDAALKNYPVGSVFTVGIDKNVTVQYCVTSLNDPTQFFFNYKTTTYNFINLKVDKDKSMAVCSNF